MNWLTLFALLGLLLGQPVSTHRSIRVTGRTTALKSSLVQVPRQYGTGGQLTLLHLVDNGALHFWRDVPGVKVHVKSPWLGYAQGRVFPRIQMDPL